VRLSFLIEGEGSEGMSGLSIIAIRKVVTVRDVPFSERSRFFLM
jgi:hypothetical protein